MDERTQRNTHKLTIKHTGEECLVNLDELPLAFFSLALHIRANEMPVAVIEVPVSEIDFEGDETVIEQLERDLFEEIGNDN